MKRKWEVMIGLIGVVLCVIFLGGFSLTMMTMDETTYKDTVFPILQESVSVDQVSESFEAVKALAAWFGTALVFVVGLTAAATAFIWRNRKPKWAALFYTGAGLATLIGTQFIAFPVAFVFFLAAFLSVFRKIVNKEAAVNGPAKILNP